MKNYLSLSVLALMFGTSVQASDTEIYQAATPNRTTLMFLLDASGSMSIYAQGGGKYACDLPSSRSRQTPIFVNYTTDISDTGVAYTRQFCGFSPKYVQTKNLWGAWTSTTSIPSSALNEKKWYYSQDQSSLYYFEPENVYADRITRLKDAMFNFLDDTTIANMDKYYVGLMSFQKTAGTQLTAPIQLSTSKTVLKQKIANIEANYTTPTAISYAQVTKTLLNSLRTGNEAKCDTQGTYVLTDGFPTNTSAVSEMRNILGSSFSCNGQFGNGVTYKIGTSDQNASWKCIADFSRSLNDKTIEKKGKNIKIPTAVVGFGSSFDSSSSATDADVVNTIKWGNNSGQVFTEASSTDSITSSIKNFLTNTSNSIEPVTMATTTIPNDPYNTSKLKSVGYLNQLQPTVGGGSALLWLGNVEKYNVLNGVLKNTAGLTALNSNGTLNKNASEGLWGGGVSAKLPASRTIVTDRKTDASNSNLLYTINSSYLNALTSDKNELSALLSSKEIGAVMHSVPALVGQSGMVKVANNTSTTADENNYVMFGTTQGLLHLIDESTGIEKFAFAPSEIINKQKTAFLGAEQTKNTSSSLSLPKDIYYGIDAPWVIDTKYTTTVGASQTTYNLTGSEAFQYAYGGLRMGGRGYYALNLKDINNPELAFHISPDDAKIYSKSGIKNYAELKNMGQSWSKPTIGYVNWKNSNNVIEKRRVMFVGGGYDAGGTNGDGEVTNGVRTYSGYENDSYTQTNGVGAAVYMFDATTGDLLWWTGANLKNSTLTTGVQFNKVNDMKYSIVSSIKKVDRNSDNLIDHLYFGDLGGQVWRVDINNDAINSDLLIKTPVKIFQNSSVRFYESPAFTSYKTSSGLLGVISIGSGNRSRPMLNENHLDSIYNIFDTDIYKNSLFEYIDANKTSYVTQSTTTKQISTNESLNSIIEFKPETSSNSSVNKTNNDKIKTSGGWYYSFSRASTTSINTKIMATPIVISGYLYVTSFDPNVDLANSTDDTSCGAATKGSSNVTQFYLPYGALANNYTIKTTSIGGGLVNPSIASVSNGNGQVLINTVATMNNNGKNPFTSFIPAKKLQLQKWFDGANNE